MFDFEDERFEEQAEICRRSYESSLECLFKTCCARGESGKTFTSAAACCVLIFVVALRSRRGRFFRESSASCTPTFSAHSCVSTCLLWTFFLYTSSHKWGIWKLFLECLLRSLETAKHFKSILPKLLGRLHVLTRPAPRFWFRYQQRWILNQEE